MFLKAWNEDVCLQALGLRKVCGLAKGWCPLSSLFECFAGVTEPLPPAPHLPTPPHPRALDIWSI